MPILSFITSSTKFTMTDKNDKNSKRDYRTSVESGLKRLESQKLGFLGAGRVVSKFDAQNIEAYAVTPAADESADDVTRDDLSRSGSERYQTDVEVPAAGKSAADDNGLGEFEDNAQTAAFEPDMIDVLKNFDCREIFGDDPDLEATVDGTLELASLRGYESCQVAAPARLKTAADELSVQQTQEAGSVSRKSDNDSFDMLKTVQAEEMPELEQLRAAYKTKELRAMVLRAAQVQPRESPNDSHEQAIDRLKNRGLFEPVMHGEVLRNLRGVQGVDALIPPSEITTYDDIDESEDKTVDQNHGAVQSLRGVVLDDEDEQTMDAGAAARAVVEQLEKNKKLQEEDERRIKNEEKRLREAEAAIRKQTEAAKKRAQNDAEKPSIAPVGRKNDAEIEGRETVPVDLSQHSLNELKKAFPAKRRVAMAQDTINTNSVLVVEDDEPSCNLALILVLVFLLICGMIWLLYELNVFSDLAKKISPYQAPQIQELVNGNDRQFMDQVRKDVDWVSVQVGNVYQNKVALHAWLDGRIERTADPMAALPYVEFALSVFPSDAGYYQKLIEAYIDTRQFKTARELLKTIPPEIRSLASIRSLGYMIFAGDPAFISPAIEVTDEMCDEIAPLGGGSTLTFKFKKKGENLGAFKPLQNRKQSNYRAEIAAWRVCELLQCDFRVPWNRPVKVERNMFNKLYNRSTSSKREAYRKELVDLTWTKEGERYYVYGTLKDWVPDFTRFPIEKTSMWRPWLSQDKFIENDKYPPLREALQPLNGQPFTQKLYTEILRQAPDLTTELLASQISQVLVFDYLIGNWDRFSGVPEWAGVNCQFKDNKIVSIDNGASFPAYSNDKVYERFMMTERFSMHMIDSLRALDKAQTFKLLFPDPSAYETSAFEQFWKQRSALLTRIDSLSQTYGSKRVLSFE